MAQKIFLGSELKFNINIEPIDQLTMKDYDFDIIIGTDSAKKMTKKFSKKGTSLDAGLKEIDDSNFIVAFNTTDIGLGKLIVQIVAHIPDGDFPDMTRTEIVEEKTGIEIIPHIW